MSSTRSASESTRSASETHKTRGYGHKLLTLNRRVFSDKGERVGEKAAPAKTASIASFMEKARGE